MAGDLTDPTLARIEQLEARIAELEGRGDARPAHDAEPQPVSRRRLLGMAGAAAAGAVGATVAAATPAGATHQPEDIGIGIANAGGATTTSMSGTVTGGLAQLQIVNTDPANGTAIEGIASGGGAGVHGQGNTGIGAYGTASSGVGIGGYSTNGISVHADRPSGHAGAGLQFAPHDTIVGPPTSTTHQLGEFWLDANGVLFQCVGTGAPGTWVRQAPLVTLPAPVRVFDSRAGQPNGGGSTQGPLTFTSAPPSAAFRDVNVSQNAVGGAVVVPAGASAVLMNLAVVSISGVGALAVCKHGATQPATANINWFAGGQVLSNAVTSAVDTNRHVDVVIVAGGGASTHFILDVVGYYL